LAQVSEKAPTDDSGSNGKNSEWDLPEVDDLNNKPN
jgi:hypothetical protein